MVPALTPVAPTSVAVAAETMQAPMTTPWSAFLAAHTGGMVSLSRPL
jgi:phospholipase/lecithinase/hemolysin